MLQTEGLKIWDASRNCIFLCLIPTIIVATADGPGAAAMSGMVGHSGKYGCRLYCEIRGQHQEGVGHYFLIMKKPSGGYNVEGSNHKDMTCQNLKKYRDNIPKQYKQNIKKLLTAKTKTKYKELCLETSLCKQTLFSAMKMLGVPNIFIMNIMHLSDLNDSNLFLGLWQGGGGSVKIYPPDNISKWDWAVFKHNPAVWKPYGETVSDAVPFTVTQTIVPMF